MFKTPIIKTDGLDSLRPKRILICQLKQIGDVILTTPTVRLLRKLYPEARIDFYTLKQCAPVLKNNPDIDTIWEVDKSLGFWETLKFYWKVGHDGYDMIFDCQQLPRITWMILMSNAPVKFTNTPPWYRSFLYTHWHQVSGPYAAKCKAGPIIRTFGEELWDNPRPCMFMTEEEQTWATDYLEKQGLKDSDTLITVDPTHRRASRRWPAKHYGELIRLALDKRPDLKFFLLYGPGERDDAEEVLKASGRPDRCILTDEILTLREMAAVIEYADFQVGNCSAPRHFAAALNTPTLTVLGATSNAWTCPEGGHEHIFKGRDCQPCNTNQCADGQYRCLVDLSPETVADKFLELLHSGK